MAGRYGIPKPTTVDGITFASKKEARRYGELRLMERAKLISSLTVQPEFKVEINGRKFCVYTADFAYELPGKLTVIEEIKSTGTRRDPAYRLRRKAAELFHDMVVTEIVS